MSFISEVTYRKWDRRLRKFWLGGGFLFIAGILVARPLTESFELMRWFVPIAMIALFSALTLSGVIWVMLQFALAMRADRDQHVRPRPMSYR